MPALPDLTPLDAGGCPLLAKYGGVEAPALVARFNAAIDQVRAATTDRVVGPLLASERFADVLGRLARVRDQLGRDRYIVGFIGVSQAGKSTTVNNVLGEEVCKPGAMDATSSQPCRIVRADRRSLDIEFLTPALVADRRQKLCEAIGLATPGEDRDLLPLLEQPDQFRLADGQERPRLRDDLKHLKDFLDATARNRTLLTAPPQKRTGLDFARRYDYTTHTRGPASAEVLVLREARFNLDNRHLPDDLELCDLPGLDSKRTIDDVVTWEYLPGLHGTFLFVNAGGNLLTEGMLKILSKINQEFRGKVGGRAWVVFNKMDALTSDSFRPGGQDNVFTTIARFLEKTGVPETQVCFGSKKIWDRAVENGGIADPVKAADAMSQPPADPVPASCPPGLRTAWQELLKDGGVAHIRRLMFGEVASALAGQIRADAERALGEFEREFGALVAAERKRASMNRADLDAAMTNYYAVFGLRVALTERPSEFPALLREGERLRGALGRLFDTSATAQVLAHLSQGELAHQFRTHAVVLDQTLSGELVGSALDQVYDEIARSLAGLPPVALASGHGGCQDAWRQMAADDRIDDAWLGARRPAFEGDELAAWLGSSAADGVAGEIYVALMRDKIDVAVRQTVHLLRSRLRLRLGHLVSELAQLSGARPPEAA